MIVATAGHVDHGKTSLVNLLSGVDTDRLPEEKARGMSIDLGFAYLAHPDDPTRLIGFVDVPGHEKFVRNMIAGVGSVDIGLLVVAADDGLMPQSIEHLAILKLLGVPAVLPVITKVDLVPDETVHTVKQSVVDHLNTLGFPADDVFAVSIHQTNTIDRLRAALFERYKAVTANIDSSYFRLAIDRCFTVSGAGTVVTGTVLSGAVQQEDNVRLVGNNGLVRVRGLRSQGEVTQQSHAGQRCALNITGGSLRKKMPVRGDTFTANPHLTMSRLIDVQLTAVGTGTSAKKHDTEQSFNHWTACHLHIAAASTTCRVALLETENLAAGQNSFARIYCDKAITSVAGDRFVLRDQSARYTIAGGHVVDPLAPRRGRSSESRLSTLRALDQPNPKAAFSELLNVSAGGLDIDTFIARFNSTSAEVDAYASTGDCYHAAGWAISKPHWLELQSKVLDSLTQWHTSHPLLLGAGIDQLLRGVRPVVIESLAGALLVSLIKDGEVVQKGAVYRLQSWTASLDDEHEQLWKVIEPMIASAGRIAPRLVEVAETLELPVEEVTKIMNTFVAHGRLFRVSANRYYLPQQLLELAQIGESLAMSEALTVAKFRDASAIGRNLVVELLEFFDRCQFTRRIGQDRQILRSAESVFA